VAWSSNATGTSTEPNHGHVCTRIITVTAMGEVHRRLLRLREVELTRDRAQRVGTLLGRAGQRDVIDGSIVDAAVDGDEILTTDPDDITALAHNSGKNLIVTRVCGDLVSPQSARMESEWITHPDLGSRVVRCVQRARHAGR
jgi:hypothetical protein